jgi:hypothetical protein
LYNILIATSVNIRTLQVEGNSVVSLSTLLIRKRSRSRIEPSEVPVIKRKKEQGEDPLITAINRSIESRLSQKSNIMKAIELLSKEYYISLSEVDFGTTTDILLDKISASVFISLLVKDIRDRWLERHTHIALLL